MAAALPAVLQFDFLHGGDELVGFVVVDGLALEQLIVEHFASAQERCHPHTVDCTAYEEHCKNQVIVDQQHDAEHQETEQRKRDAEGLLGEERLHAGVV